nr:6-phospho-beta-glucosidase [Streptococcus oralis]
DRVLELVTDPEKQITMENIAALHWEPDFIRGLRAIPCPYHRYYYKTREMLEEEKEASVEKGTRAEVVKQLEDDLFELYKDPNLHIKPPQLEKRGGAYYSDAACSLITSIYNNKG